MNGKNTLIWLFLLAVVLSLGLCSMNRAHATTTWRQSEQARITALEQTVLLQQKQITELTKCVETLSGNVLANAKQINKLADNDLKMVNTIKLLFDSKVNLY